MNASLLSGVIVLAISGLFGYHNIYMRAQQELRAVREQEQLEGQTQELRTQLAATLEQVERLRKRLSPSPETEWLVEQVGPLAARSGIQFTSINPRAPTAMGEMTSLTVSLQFGATFHDLGAFLSAVESSTAFIRIEELDVSVPDADGVSQVKLVLTTLHVPSLPGASEEKEGPV